MKIRINYDLIDKIKESKRGFFLQKIARNIVVYTSINTLLWLPISISTSSDILQQTINDFLYFLSGYSLTFVCSALFFKNQNKLNAISELKQLTSLLRNHYINTDYELLQKAYEYEINYKFVLGENKIPRLKQDKYIMVPVVDRDGEKEVSLVQEHLIGSKDYELSYGSPTKSKVLKPAFNC